MSRRFKSKKLYFASRVRLICGINNIKVGERTCFGEKAILTAIKEYMGYCYDPQIHIGMNCNFGDWIHISAINRITIGNNVLTGRFVIINDNSHGKFVASDLDIPPVDRELHSRGSITIGNNVWLGDKVAILGGVTIGEGAIVGANAVVTKDIPPYCVAVGIPARVVKNNASSSIM